NDVHALAGERVEIDGERSDQRLAFAGLHFRDAALVQHHAADELHVEVALAERTLRGFAHGGESRNKNRVERSAVRNLLLEFRRASAKFLVAELLHLGLERVDLADLGVIAAQAPLVGRAENLAGDSADHYEVQIGRRLRDEIWTTPCLVNAARARK